ncbi:hypothetical protein PIB30_078585 [Stylosanthes scabra]|uniref:DNA-directed DNA polymerase n=1 Tax=Stylosanthes scabra TaxID=79078 RepID=A0ABU6XPS7_9FABA|nr:hypothetical protein [Stylosanthes scabra]
MNASSKPLKPFLVGDIETVMIDNVHKPYATGLIFDGILLLKHLAWHHTNYKLKPLMRNNRLYEIAVYSNKIKKLLFRFRDSLHHLPGKLDNLAKSLCPDLGRKGTIQYDEVRQSNLKEKKSQLLGYMEQDIRLLGGVMRRAQEIYWD